MTSQPPAPGRGSAYTIEVFYHRRMKPQRVYALVVEVPRGKGAVPRDAPSGMTVLVRPIVPGSLVVPAEAPLEVSRPGARATFHVTPLARGRLRDAQVRIHHNGRTVQEVPTCMKATTQRWAWILLLLALIAPPLLLHYTRDEPLRGIVDGREGTPGEVLKERLHNGLGEMVSAIPGSGPAVDSIASGAGTGYDTLCRWVAERHAAGWLGVALLGLALGSWALHRPRRARRWSSVALPPAVSAATHHSDATAETLPLVPPEE